MEEAEPDAEPEAEVDLEAEADLDAEAEPDASADFSDDPEADLEAALSVADPDVLPLEETADLESETYPLSWLETSSLDLEE